MESNVSKLTPATREGTYTSIGYGEVGSARFGTPLPPLHRSVVPRYLVRFGYQASDIDQWVKPPTECNWPICLLSVKGSYEMLAHTWYCVRVSLSTAGNDLEPGKSTSWTVPRRLCQFQDGLFEYVNALPTAVHKEHFCGVTFAARSGSSVTAEKLNGWCTALSAAINSGQASPIFVARCLRWTEQPTAAVWDVVGQNLEAEGDHGAAADKREHTATEKTAPNELASQPDELVEVVDINEKPSEGLEPIEETEDEDILRAMALAQQMQDVPDIDV